MKRAVRRGVLAALVTGLVLGVLLFPSGGGAIAYFFSNTHYRRPIEALIWLMFPLGGFVCGMVNAAMSVSVGWLLIGLALMPMAFEVIAILVALFGVGYEWGDFRFLWLPLATTAMTILPSLLAKLFRRPSPLA